MLFGLSLCSEAIAPISDNDYFKLTFPLPVFSLGHIPDYTLVTAMPVVILDEEHKHAARVSADEKMSSRDETSSNKSAGTSATITNTTRNG